MTEDEAKTKVCPMSFNAPVENCAMPCCGSNCACWVWDYRVEKGYDEDSGHCGLIR